MGQGTDLQIRTSTNGYALRQMPEQRVPATRPDAKFLLRNLVSADDDAPGIVTDISTALRPAPLVGMIVELLDRAAAAVGTDHAVAKYCIARATTLLQRDHHAANRDCRGTAPKVARGGLSPWQVRLVTKHIDDSLASTIRTDDCAAIARLSNSYFRRAFKESFGMTFYSYLSRRRVERAQEMMVMTDQPLREIAERCGFADPPHFARVFRRLVGSSPGDWRRL